MNGKPLRLAIVGGGAAGLTAAIAAGEQARLLGRAFDTSIFERDDRVGRSILVTGNGRCNFSNQNLETRHYHNADFVEASFDALAAPDFGLDWQNGSSRRKPQADAGRRVLDFLESLGLEWRSEGDGRLYPLANKASVVVDVLRAAARRAGAHERCEAAVSAIEPPYDVGKPFTLRMKDGTFERADAVVLACGGRALRSIEVHGLSPEPLHPMLGPLRVVKDELPLVRELDNIRVRCSVNLLRPRKSAYSRIASEAGELMFRKYGVSGICVFNLSRIAEPGDVLNIGFLQTCDRDRVEQYLTARRADLETRFGSMSCADFLRGMVLPRVGDVLLKVAHLSGSAPCDDAALERLAWELSGFTLTVDGIGDLDNCQIMRGGFAVEGFNPTTMESRQVQGLYVVGEALDVDGPCGGYNLHWAWTSGLLAGAAAARALADIEEGSR